MGEQAFKEIKIKTSYPVSREQQRLVQDFMSPFHGHIFCKHLDDKNLNIFVNCLDFKQLTASAEHLKATMTNQQNIALIDDIVTAISRVRSYGIKSGKRIYGDYNAERKVKNRKLKSAHRTQKRYLTKEKEKENALPPAYENKVVCGDSLNILKELPDNCIDIMLTSPPYNFGLAYRESDDTDDWDAYFQQLFAILEETYRVLKSGGRLIINVQPLFSDYIPTHHLISKKMLDIGMLWKGEILWEKNNYNCKYTAWGSWKSPSSPYLKYTWEFIEVFCKDSFKHHGSKDHIDISGDEFKKWVYAKWSMAPERNMKGYGHPAMFPEALVERVLKLFSYQDDIVLDVFNGAGTTTAVAKKLNRRYLGIDISPDYCATAEERLNDILI